MIKFSAIIFSLIFFANNSDAFDLNIDNYYEPSCGEKESILVFDENNREILFQRKAEKIIYPASLTKLMTLYLTFEALEKKQILLDEKIEISELAEEVAKVNKITTLRLKQKDQITVKQAIEGVIVKSFNEASIALAEKVAANEWEFVRKMNKKARELGMINTSFRNSSGLFEEGNYSTAFDLARLAYRIKKDFAEYFHFFSLKNFSYQGKEFKSHNHVLLDYKGVDGMKTGYTKISGFNLITSAKKNNRRIISVVVGCDSFQKRDKMMKKLLDFAFEEREKDKKIQLKFFLKLSDNIST
jgi:D-alanyl-D-alanine carboxypeptidase